MRLVFIFALLTVNTMFAGEIITTNDFTVIEREAHQLDNNSLILFDVDATLIVPNDVLLKPKGKGLFEQLIAGYTDRDLFREIRMQAPHSLLDERSIDLIQYLQHNKIPVIAFTAAPSKIHGVEEIGAWRVDELKQHGFDFSLAFPNLTFIELPKNPSQQHLPLFKSGVLYSSFHSKGDILIMFLQKIGFKPTKVVFVDDELKHVESVVAALDQENIPCVGIHYTAANKAPCELNEELSVFQIHYFVEHDVWLSDKKKQSIDA